MYIISWSNGKKQFSQWDEKTGDYVPLPEAEQEALREAEREHWEKLWADILNRPLMNEKDMP